jgi:dephospho-CoA kinase
LAEGNRLFRVGLTGGIASGKSTVANRFAELGAGVIDTDEVAREVVAAGEPGLDSIVEAFGHSVLTELGELDRSAMRSIVFSDPNARRRLENILHPLIRARTLCRLEALSAPYAVVVVPLLVETRFDELVDRVLVVDCRAETQRERLMARDHIDSAQADAMITAQIDRDSRNERAHDILENGPNLSATLAGVDRLHRDYLNYAAGSGSAS